MKNVKTLMLAAVAAVAALSLGVGSAMAQLEVPSMVAGTYFSGQRPAAPPIDNTWAGQPQSGSADVESTGNHAQPRPAYDYGTLANPG